MIRQPSTKPLLSPPGCAGAVVPFDVLHRRRDLRAEAYTARRAQLEAVVDAAVDRHDRAGRRTVGRAMSTPDAGLLWSFVRRR